MLNIQQAQQMQHTQEIWSKSRNISTSM